MDPLLETACMLRGAVQTNLLSLDSHLTAADRTSADRALQIASTAIDLDNSVAAIMELNLFVGSLAGSENVTVRSFAPQFAANIRSIGRYSA